MLFSLAVVTVAPLACNLISYEASLLRLSPQHEDASMTTSRKWISCLTAVAALSVFSLSSNAAESTNTALSRTVKTWDLDFAKSADVQTFNVRVREAASDV